MIEYFYSAHSAFAYLGSARFMEIARAAGRQIAHRPIDLDKVLAVTGPGATGGQTPACRAYFFGREIERWAEERGAPVIAGTPSNHYSDMTLANGILIAGLLQGQNIDRLAHRLLEAHWRDNADRKELFTGYGASGRGADFISAKLNAAIRRAGVPRSPRLTSYSFRHGIVEALRAANVQEDLKRRLLGHSAPNIHGRYGATNPQLVEAKNAMAKALEHLGEIDDSMNSEKERLD